MKKLIFKYFKLSLIALLILHVFFIIKRGFEFPFDDIGDFCKKLFLTLAMSLPIYVILSLLSGIIFALIFKKKLIKKS